MTKKEIDALRSQIGQYLPELKVEIDGAKADLKSARTLKAQIERIVDTSQTLIERLEDPTIGVDASLIKSNEDLNTIKSNTIAAQELLEKVQSTLDTTKLNISEMETAYTDFITIKDKINDPTNGLLATLDIAKEIRRQSLSATTRVTNLLSDSDNNLIKLQNHITNIDKVYDDFLISKKKIDDPTSGLEAILITTQKLRDDIAAVAETSNTHFAQIIKYKDEAAKNIDNIKSNKEDSDTTLTKIKENEEESKQTKDNISKIFEIVSQSGHAHYFNKRRKFIIWVAGVWLTLGIAALVVAIILGHEIVNDLLNDNVQLSTIITKSFVVTPLLIFTFYALRNYGRERTLLEQYAFKEVSASTIEGSIALVQRAMKGANELNSKLLDVAIGVVRDLHAEPLELRKSSRFSLKTNNKLVGITGILEDNVSNSADK